MTNIYDCIDIVASTGQAETPNTLPGIGRLAGKFDFRLGTTSYVVPADLQTNVIALAEYVDDIEVLLFEFEEISDLPDETVIQTLRQMQVDHDVSYTVHFPLDCFLGDSDDKVRIRSVLQCKRIIQRMEPLFPFGYVLHLPIGPSEKKSLRYSERWYRNVVDSVEEVLTTGIDPKRICVETLSYPFDIAWPIVKEFGISVCMDIGHLLMNGYDLNHYYESYFDHTRVIHLHGINNGKDHRAISHLPAHHLDKLLHLLALTNEKPRVLTLEVFGVDDFAESIKTMEKYVDRG